MEFVTGETFPYVTLVEGTKRAEDIAIQAMENCHCHSLAIQNLVEACEKGHLSVLEHNSFTFSIQCSTVTRTHFIRHRLASFTERSLRFTEPTDVILPTITDVTSRELMVKACNDAFETYNQLRRMGVSKEDARYILPQATMTEFFLTANARELLHIIKLRTSPAALAETRQIAEEIFRIMETEMPHIFGNDTIIQQA